MTDEPPPTSHEPLPPTSNRAAVAGLTLGILSLVGGLTAIPGLICAVIGLRRSRERGSAGRGQAAYGLILSTLGMSILLLTVRQGVRLYFRADPTKLIASNNLERIGIAMHNFNDANNRFPSPYFRSPREPVVESELNSNLSWRVEILPYIVDGMLFNPMDCSEPWDSPRNKPFASRVIRSYTDPETRDDPDTRYRVFYGPSTVFPLDRPASKVAITDGMSNTLLVIESGEKVTWTRFAELKFDPNNPPDPTTMGRPNQTTFQATMADGSVRAFRKSMNPQVLKNAITPYGGEVMNFDD